MAATATGVRRSGRYQPSRGLRVAGRFLEFGVAGADQGGRAAESGVELVGVRVPGSLEVRERLVGGTPVVGDELLHRPVFSAATSTEVRYGWSGR
ncbi:hypothetical protein [Nocardia sp. NPDC050406]|uniref:hypothetical protein n=1 Tax=Nocardia sp. NPDC050406 TaxID=3364318 RepID=UPI0037A33684